MMEIFPSGHPLTLASSGAYTLEWWTATLTNGALGILSPSAQHLTGQQLALIGVPVIALRLKQGGSVILTTWVHHTWEKAADVRERASMILADLMGAHAAGTLPPDFSAMIQ